MPICIHTRAHACVHAQTHTVNTKKIFKGEQQNQLTPNMLDSILKDVATTPKFRNYRHKEDELNYLIQNALKNNQLNLQLFSIQHQINKNTY